MVLDKLNKAIKKGHELIGKLEVLLARDPSLSLIPINVDFQKEEFVTDIETIRKTVKLAQEAMDNEYYRLASDLLKDMRSEIIISTYLLPTATYPDAIKAAVALLEEDKPDEAKAILLNVMGTIVVEKTIEPLYKKIMSKEFDPVSNKKTFRRYLKSIVKVSGVFTVCFVEPSV